MIYRKMEPTPPAKPPRREWALARALRDDDGAADWFASFVALAAAALVWVILSVASGFVVPLSRDDTPPPPSAGVWCIRSNGVWHSGEIDGKHAEWCSWGQR